MIKHKRRTAARLTSKPPTPFEKEMNGRDAGRQDALAGKKRRDLSHLHHEDEFYEGYMWGYASIVENDMVGR